MHSLSLFLSLSLSGAFRHRGSCIGSYFASLVSSGLATTSGDTKEPLSREMKPLSGTHTISTVPTYEPPPTPPNHKLQNHTRPDESNPGQ